MTLIYWLLISLFLNPANADSPPPKPKWHGWMIVDTANHRIAFLPVERKLDLTNGVVVEGVRSSNGAYAFTVPYDSEFVGIVMTQDQLAAIKPLNATCALAVQPSGIPDPHNHLMQATFQGVTGPLLRAYSAPGVPGVFIGSGCPSFLK